MSLETYLDSLSNQAYSLDHCHTARTALAMRILRVSAMLSVQAIPVELFLGTFFNQHNYALENEQSNDESGV
jgi:hypothetical protein